MTLKDEIKNLCIEKGITFKELAERSGLVSNGLYDKFRRDSLTVKDLKKLLTALDKEMVFQDKNK